MTQTGRRRLASRIHAETVRRVEARDEDEPSPELAVRNSDIRFDDVISLAEVKELAGRLPPGSTARKLLFALNDNETRWIALGQLLLIHTFLWEEFKT